MHTAHARRVVRNRVPAIVLGVAALMAAAAGFGPAHRQTATATAGLDAVLASPARLASLWDAEHVAQPIPPLLTHAAIVERLAAVRAASPDLFSLEAVGQSVEGRPIQHIWFGRGPLHVLLWSQMHGDEPTATAALFDVLETVRRHRDEPAIGRWLQALTVHVVPMLNPDGAERFQRRNAQGLDVNRDALLLQSPEGRALKALRDRLNPAVGFNLHNQNWRTAVGTPPKPASISLLAVAFDEAGTENAGRILTKKLCATIRDALEPLAPGQVGRYDEDFEVRAFGDNLTKWGTPIVLIETGAWPAPDPDAALVRLNYVAIASSLDALATGRVNAADPERYRTLPVNRERLLHTIVRGATIVPGTGVAPFIGDVGIAASRVVGRENGERVAGLAGRIDDIGDLRVYGALDDIDGRGLTLAPLARQDIRAGQTIGRDEITSVPSGAAIAVGRPARLLLLRPQGDGFVVERVIAFDPAPPGR